MGSLLERLRTRLTRAERRAGRNRRRGVGLIGAAAIIGFAATLSSTSAAIAASEPSSKIWIEMSAFPARGTVVQSMDFIQYSINIFNGDEVDGAVDYTVDLSDVLDDAMLSMPITASVPTLTVSTSDDGKVHVTGTAAPRHISTVSISVGVNSDDERGNSVLRALVARTDAVNPECGDVGVACTEHVAGAAQSEITVDPPSGSTVHAGGEATYTMTFRNTGAVPGKVYADVVLTGVLDDADVTELPLASSDVLAVSSIIEQSFEGLDQRFSITGMLPPGETVTVQFRVTAKPDGERGDDRLDAFLVSRYSTPSTPCDGESRWPCTVTYVEAEATPTPSATSMPTPTSTPTPTPTPTPTMPATSTPSTPTSPEPTATVSPEPIATSPATPSAPRTSVAATFSVSLPRTGADVGMAPVLGALALLAVGGLVLLARRRANSQRQ